MQKSLLELVNLIGQNIRLRYEIEIRLRVFHLHFLDVECKFVFSGELEAEWEMIDLLRGGQALVEVGFALRVRPQHVPIVPVSIHHTV